jgi:hypothetical protein
MKIEGNNVLFSTGKVKYAHCGIIGLRPNMQVTDGYCGESHEEREEWMDYEDYEASAPLTAAEQIELADYMIEQWKKFKSNAEQKE